MFARLPAAQLLGRLVGSGAVQSCRGFAEVTLANLGPNACMTTGVGRQCRMPCNQNSELPHIGVLEERVVSKAHHSQSSR